MKKGEKRKAAESCEILITNLWGEGPIQDVAGVITLENGKLRCLANKGYEILLENVMRERTKKPRAWLRSLPSKYTGSMVRARLVKGE